MELFLNILWVLIATGLLWAWRSRWVYQRKRTSEHPVREWTAIGVALVLLFFAVSMTDDLHADLVLFDESSTSRRGSAIEMHSPRPESPSKIRLHGAGPALVSKSGLARIPRFSEAAHSLAPLVAVTHCKSSVSGRAPPASSA
jgi:hypothetical protein